MLTANHMTCPLPEDHHGQLKPEFNQNEPRIGFIYMPSWGAIDAPDTMPAGSTYQYRLSHQYTTAMPTSFSRK